MRVLCVGLEGRDDIEDLHCGNVLKKVRWLSTLELESSGGEASDVAIVRFLSKAMAPGGLLQRRSPRTYELEENVQDTWNTQDPVEARNVVATIIHATLHMQLIGSEFFSSIH